MVKRMLVDATHPEETRVVVLDGTRLQEFDVETSTKKQNKGNIYLAKVVRVEPSLQAAFVDYGGNRHGFLAFSEIHPDYYQIPVADRERLLAEVHRHAQEEDALDTVSDAPHDPIENDHPDDHPNVEDDHPELDGAETDGEEANGGDDHSDKIAPEALSLEFSPPSISAEVTEEIIGEHAALKDEAREAVEDVLAPAVDEANESAAEATENASLEPSDAGDSSQEAAAQEEQDALPAIEADADPNGTAPEAPPKSSGVETVGGDDEDDSSGQDRKRRRFLASRHYKIQEVIKRRQIMLVQVVKEERGNKGAALTTFLSLAGRYCVLMPNSARGGGVSRKITSSQDRRRLKTILGDLELPSNMAVILRTAGAERNKSEIKRDYEYLQRTWNSIREVTMTSRAPALIHEEASLIKRAIRDIYTRDIEEVWVDGEEGYKTAKDFMKMLTPSHAKKVQKYKDEIIPLFHRYQVETQLEAINNPVIQLKSGGSIVFAQTEALVAIDVNSGRSTKERHIEETAYRTNLEAAEEIARQLRLRDLAGLVVIDFIDMEENRNNHAVERRLKEALRADRARIQVGRISHFGLLELSRQRLRPSLIEANFRVCSHCSGAGLVRSTESAAVHSLRVLEEEGVRQRSSEVTITVHSDVALYLLNYKRQALASIEGRYGLKIFVLGDNSLVPPDMRIDRVKATRQPGEEQTRPAALPKPEEEAPEETEELVAQEEDTERDTRDEEENDGGRKKRRRRRRRRGGEGRGENGGESRHADRDGNAEPQVQSAGGEPGSEDTEASEESDQGDSADAQDRAAGGRDEQGRRGRRRGRRGGRRRRGGSRDNAHENGANDNASSDSAGNHEPDAQEHAAAGHENRTDAVHVEAAHAAEAHGETNGPVRAGEATAQDKDSGEKDSRSGSRLFRPFWKRADASPATEAPANTSQDKSPEPKSEPAAEPAPSGPPRRGWWQQGSGE